MHIELQQAGKRFNRDWIFRNLSFSFQPNETYAITGPNGSGKSTLLQLLGNISEASEGSILYDGMNSRKNEDLHEKIALAAPYLECIEEMTALEMIIFHSHFKTLKESISTILETVGLASSGHKQIRYFSSGMKQRLKLGLAFFSETPVLLLDEPFTNLDKDGMTLYESLMNQSLGKRTVIISSNDPAEYHFTNNIINIADFKS